MNEINWFSFILCRSGPIFLRYQDYYIEKWYLHMILMKNDMLHNYILKLIENWESTFNLVMKIMLYVWEVVCLKSEWALEILCRFKIIGWFDH